MSISFPPFKKFNHVFIKHLCITIFINMDASNIDKQIKEIEEAFRQLPSKIPTIVGFEWGTNNSPEGLAQDYTHCFFVTFDDAKGRAVYLPHPEHKKFVALLKPALDKVCVVDYVAKETAD